MIQWDGGGRNVFCLTDSLWMIQADTPSLGNPDNLSCMQPRSHCLPLSCCTAKLVCIVIDSVAFRVFSFFFFCDIIITYYGMYILKTIILHRFIFSFNTFTRFKLRRIYNKKSSFPPSLKASLQVSLSKTTNIIS